jgi:hypothetical protein
MIDYAYHCSITNFVSPFEKPRCLFSSIFSKYLFIVYAAEYCFLYLVPPWPVIGWLQLAHRLANSSPKQVAQYGFSSLKRKLRMKVVVSFR